MTRKQQGTLSCDAVTFGHNSRAMLERNERAHLFLMPLDN
jgi:ATP/maltotriose-dependent transcriptional regulator MalT